jgi:hypothetical protein
LDIWFAKAEPLLRAYLDVDFTPALGRQISCFHPRNRSLQVFMSESTIGLSFTPMAADCGLEASGQIRGDSILGQWREPGFAGSTTWGQFLMHRESAH